MAVADEALDNTLLVQARGGIQDEEPALGQSPEMVLDYQRPEIDPAELQTSSYGAADDTRQDYSWGIKTVLRSRKVFFRLRLRTPALRRSRQYLFRLRFRLRLHFIRYSALTITFFDLSASTFFYMD